MHAVAGSVGSSPEGSFTTTIATIGARSAFDSPMAQ